MKTSLIDTQQLDAYLHGLDEKNAPVVEARLILEPGFKEKLEWQQKTYLLIQDYGRAKLKAEIELVHQKIFFDPAHTSFRKKIANIFKLL